LKRPVIPHAVDRLVRMNMTIKFEWQFKYRDESSVNAASGSDPARAKKPSFDKG
jgi:hypothetical protein